ncbi:hypothetical protein HPB48_003456 [Haemaphysalis longicornis]|uniref:Ig-like domain-containing protein n=1 Tax=Haemaphysalis longicornis TaxID=44386 RepID=A0A9J6GG63_HAELO|nr:hypothetical protein HPB48_003456 [Haemaphysalis longicornis]
MNSCKASALCRQPWPLRAGEWHHRVTRVAMLRPFVIALGLSVAHVGADEPRKWYEGNLSQVPDHRLVARQPVAVAGAGTVLFACSAASWDAVRFAWHLDHPADVSVSRSSRARSIRLEYEGRDVYVRDSLIRLWSRSPHSGTVRCSVRSPDGETRALLSANYSLLASAGLEWCSAFCPPDRASCALGESGAPECRCGEAFPRRDPFHGVCFAPVKLGQPCVFDHECEANQSWCQSRACTCRPLFEPAAGDCVPVARLGESCAPGQCSGPYSSCRDGRCACYKGYDDIDGVCVPGRTSLPGGNRNPFATPVFGELRADSSTWLLLACFCVVLVGITVCHTLMDARRFKPKTPAALVAPQLK